MHSADSGTLVVPRTRTTIGQQDFAVSGWATWNNLPVELRASTLSITETFVKIFPCLHRPKIVVKVTSSDSASKDSVYNWRCVNIRTRTGIHSFIVSFVQSVASGILSLV